MSYVVIMFVAEAALVLLFVCLFFIFRFYIVVKTGLSHRPGTKGPVSVLVVAGSGEVTRFLLSLCSDRQNSHMADCFHS